MPQFRPSQQVELADAVFAEGLLLMERFLQPRFQAQKQASDLGWILAASKIILGTCRWTVLLLQELAGVRDLCCLYLIRSLL